MLRESNFTMGHNKTIYPDKIYQLKEVEQDTLNRKI